MRKRGWPFGQGTERVARASPGRQKPLFAKRAIGSSPDGVGAGVGGDAVDAPSIRVSPLDGGGAVVSGAVGAGVTGTCRACAWAAWRAATAAADGGGSNASAAASIASGAAASGPEERAVPGALADTVAGAEIDAVAGVLADALVGTLADAAATRGSPAGDTAPAASA